MIINKMNENNINTTVGLEIQRKLRSLLDEKIISYNISRTEIKIICEELIKEQDNELFEGFWPIIASKNMPSDAAVDFLHVPTQYATMILLRAYLMNIHFEIENFEDSFRRGLLASIRSKFRGHGYEATYHQLKMVKLLIQVGLLEFLDLYGDFCSEFTITMKCILDNICNDKQKGKVIGAWGEDYTELYNFIFNSIKSYNLKAFVYGTLMIDESNHGFVKNCPTYGDAKIKGYDLYDTGYGYPAVVYSKGQSDLVEGEIYGINKTILKDLDYLEDNGDMYTREFTVAADSKGNKHLALVYKYNYPVDENKRIKTWKNRISSDDKVWYVSYGSNLCYERFMDYINRCSDTTEPIYDRAVLFSHQLYFARESILWGYKGTAFIDSKYDSTYKTIGRMYLITKQQFEEIKYYEGPKYQNRVDLGTYNGLPMVSFTDFEMSDYNSPNEAYRQVVARGIKELFENLSEAEINKYIDYHCK